VVANNSTRNEMLTCEQAAARLGLKVATLRAWVARRRVGYSKLGRSVRIPAAEVERLIASGFVPALPERAAR
jgi:excisionase family DNA binding protein